MNEYAVSLYSAEISNIGGNYKITAYLALENNGKQLGIDRVIANSKDSKELKKCIDQLFEILAEKN